MKYDLKRLFLETWQFIRTLVKIIGILVDSIFLVNSTRILIFTRIFISIRILVISIRILIDLTKKLWFVHLELLFDPTRSFFSMYLTWTVNFRGIRRGRIYIYVLRNGILMFSVRIPTYFCTWKLVRYLRLQFKFK